MLALMDTLHFSWLCCSTKQGACETSCSTVHPGCRGKYFPSRPSHLKLHSLKYPQGSNWAVSISWYLLLSLQNIFPLRSFTFFSAKKFWRFFLRNAYNNKLPVMLPPALPAPFPNIPHQWENKVQAAPTWAAKSREWEKDQGKKGERERSGRRWEAATCWIQLNKEWGKWGITAQRDTGSLARWKWRSQELLCLLHAILYLTQRPIIGPIVHRGENMRFPVQHDNSLGNQQPWKRQEFICVHNTMPICFFLLSHSSVVEERTGCDLENLSSISPLS